MLETHPQKDTHGPNVSRQPSYPDILNSSRRSNDPLWFETEAQLGRLDEEMLFFTHFLLTVLPSIYFIYHNTP